MAVLKVSTEALTIDPGFLKRIFNFFGFMEKNFTKTPEQGALFYNVKGQGVPEDDTEIVIYTDNETGEVISWQPIKNNA